MKTFAISKPIIRTKPEAEPEQPLADVEAAESQVEGAPEADLWTEVIVSNRKRLDITGCEDDVLYIVTERISRGDSRIVEMRLNSRSWPSETLLDAIKSVLNAKSKP